MAKKQKRVSEQLRAAITASGLTHYALGKLAATAPHMIDRFMAGKDLRGETIDRLCDALKLDLVERK
jgi:hypothetical protein